MVLFTLRAFVQNVCIGENKKATALGHKYIGDHTI